MVAPVAIAANANQPTIAVSGTVIGVAYLTSGGIVRYISKQLASTTWSSPVNIYSLGVSRDPAMVSYGSKMYLTWAASDTYVFYVSFPPVITGAVPAAKPVNFTSLCFGYSTISFKPAIAVSPTAANNSQPLVRIAFFRSENQMQSASCSGYSNFGYEVMEIRPSTSYQTNVLTTLGPYSGTPEPVSLSIAANPNNGDFYVAVSQVINGAGKADLVYENAWNANDTWRFFTVLPRKAHVDVEASCPNFRIAVSDFTQGAGGYGPTWYRTGTWTGQAAMSPTWDEPTEVSVSASGANPQALFLTTHTGTVLSGTSHLISAAFDDTANSSSYSLKHDDRSFKGPSIVTACPAIKRSFDPKAF